MKLHSFATNRTLLTFDDGSEVFFSYQAPVAGYSKKLGYIKTNRWYSSTTTRHINRYFNDVWKYSNLVGFDPDDDVKTVDQSVINNLIREYIPNRY